MASVAPGDDVDAYCVECEAVAGHKILAMKGNKPDRVECKKCGATHAFGARKPTPRKK